MLMSEDNNEHYRKLGTRLLKKLRATGNPADVLGVVRKFQREMDRSFFEAPAEERARIACGPGCAWCCHVPMGVQAHEVLIAADFAQRHFTPAELEVVVAQASIHHARTQGIDSDSYAAMKLACPLLRFGSCSAYEDRPEVCRAHHSSSADACQHWLGQSAEDTGHYLLALRARMFAAMGGIDQAVTEFGLDSRQYHFGAALYEALTDSLCLDRWLRRQQTFSDQVREIQGPAGHFTPSLLRTGVFG